MRTVGVGSQLRQLTDNHMLIWGMGEAARGWFASCGSTPNPATPNPENLNPKA